MSESSLFKINIAMTKNLLKKYRMETNSKLKYSDFNFLSTVISDYYKCMHEEGYFGESQAQGKRESNLSEADSVSEKLKKWEDLSNYDIPDSYEKYMVISSIMGLSYFDIIAFESDYIKEEIDTWDWTDILKLSEIKVKGKNDDTINKIRLPLLRDIALRKKLDEFGEEQSETTKKGYEFVRDDSQYNEIKHLTLNRMQKEIILAQNTTMNTQKNSRISGENISLFTRLNKKIELSKLEINKIIEEINIVRDLYRTRNNLASVEKLFAFEYLFEKSIDELYGVSGNSRQNGINVNIPEGNVDLERENKRIINSVDAFKGFLAEKFLYIAGANDFEIKEADRNGVIFYSNGKYGVGVVESALIAYTDCEYDFVNIFRDRIEVVIKDSPTSPRKAMFLQCDQIKDLPGVHTIWTSERENKECIERSVGFDITRIKLETFIAAAKIITNIKNNIYVCKKDNEIILYDLVNGRDYHAYPHKRTFKSELFYIKNVTSKLYGAIDDDLYILPLYDELPKKGDGKYLICQDGLYGFIGSDGQMIAKPQYREANIFCEGVASVKNEEGKFIYIDSDNQLAFNKKFDYAYNFKNGYATVEINGQEGVIDKTGEFVIEPSFEEIYEFSEGLAVAKKDTKYGYINIKGEFKTEQIYDQAASFENGQASVMENGILKKITKP